MEEQIQQMEDRIHQEYKDWDVYENDWNAVCYIPENAGQISENVADDYYTHNRLLALVNGDKELCDQLFEVLNWTFPETLIDENLNDGLWGYCKSCKQYYDTHDEEITHCPKCGAKIEEV